MALTKYKEGSLKELATLSFPLMITSLSIMLMLFVDRLMLANYSLDAHNASVKAATLGWVFIFGFGSLVGIAEVFVAQYNGADQKDKLGEPVWQMIWLSLGSLLLFVPLGVWGSKLIYGSVDGTTLEEEYFYWMMLFGPLFTMQFALSGFFIGQGKTRLITILAVFSNFVNAVLDYCFIFGVEGYIQPMGIKGAALATIAGVVFQILVLFGVFFNAKSRSNFGTGKFQYNHAMFMQCLKVGVPGALFSALEILGFAVYYWLMTFMEPHYLVITGICQSVILLLYFYTDGISKAAMTLAGNMIGAKRPEVVSKVFFSGIKLHFIFMFVLLLLVGLHPDWIINRFIPDPSHLTQQFFDSFQTCLMMIAFYMFFEGIRQLLWGVLTSAGDTMFLLFAGTLSVWMLLVLPVYVFVVRGHASVEIAWMLCLVHSSLTCGIYTWRFFGGKWKSIELISGS